MPQSARRHQTESSTLTSQFIFGTGCMAVCISCIVACILLSGLSSSPFLVSEQLSTGICLLLSGIALIAGNRGQRRLAEATSATVAMFCLFTLIASMTGTLQWFDQLFRISDPRYFIPFPGRMPPNAVGTFLLSSVVIYCCVSQIRFQITTPAASMIGVLVVGIAGAALFGWAFSIEVGYVWGQNNPLPPLSAIGIMAVGAGIIGLVWKTFSQHPLEVRQIWRAVTIYAMSALFTFGLLTAFYAALPFYDWIQKDTLGDLADHTAALAASAQQHLDSLQLTGAALQKIADQELEEATDENDSPTQDPNALRELIRSEENILGFTRRRGDVVLLTAGFILPTDSIPHLRPHTPEFSFHGPVLVNDIYCLVGVATRRLPKSETVTDSIIVSLAAIEHSLGERLKGVRGVETFLLNRDLGQAFEYHAASARLSRADTRTARQLARLQPIATSTEVEVVGSPQKKEQLRYGVSEQFGSGRFAIVQTVNARRLFQTVNQNLIEFLVIAFLFLGIGSLGVFFLVRELVVFVERLQSDVESISARATAMFENSSDAIVAINSDGSISTANSRAGELLGEAVFQEGTNIDSVLSTSGENRSARDAIRQAVQENVGWLSFDVPDQDGRSIILEGIVTILDPHDEGVVALFLRDVTDRRRAEQFVEQSLKEKDVLLREIHHRVKNNLQVISSLLRLQARKSKDEKLGSALRESQNRISSIALLHELLYQSDLTATVNFRQYIEHLCSSVLRSYGAVERIETDISVEEIDLPLDSAMPCGLLITEIITNVIKHAFPKKQKDATLSIAVQKLPENRISLRVADNGVGMEVKKEQATVNGSSQDTSLGTKLVDNLVKQIQGEYTVTSGGGTAYEITFPLESNAF